MNPELIIEPLLKWYSENKRILPWRVEKDPYKIWISEIMLQQTRIEAVKEYYKKFMQEIPNVHELANIEEEKLLKIWQGLGYYNRAKNLRKAAQKIENQYNGKIPSTYEELLKLPGVGEYTAAAIASIAYNEKVPAVDGNVLRVISRIIGNNRNILDKAVRNEIFSILQQIIPKNAGDFNEALMELGEVICLPNQEPLCSKCPLKKECYACQNNLTTVLPVRENAINKKIENKTILLLVTEENEIALLKRPNKGLLADMYELPNIQGFFKEKDIASILKKWNLKYKDIQKLGERKHIFTHIIWKMVGYQILVDNKNKDFLWISKEKLQREYPIPTAFNGFLK